MAVDIDQLTKAVIFMAELGNVAHKVIHTDSTLGRSIAALELGDEFMVLLKANFAEMKIEAANLDATEKAHLYNAFKSKFEIKDDVLEANIEKAVQLAINLGDMVQGALEIVKAIKTT